MSKYEIEDGHWDKPEETEPPAWKEDTSAELEVDVVLQEQGYQNNRKWTVHFSDHVDDGRMVAIFAVEHRNKGNYWREGKINRDAIDFVDLPLVCRQRVADMVNREIQAITPEKMLIDDE